METWLGSPTANSLIKKAESISLYFDIKEAHLKQLIERNGMTHANKMVRDNSSIVFDHQSSEAEGSLISYDFSQFNNTEFYLSWIYFAIGFFLSIWFISQVGNTNKYLTRSMVEILLIIFFFFQIYQGFTIQEYAESFVDRFYSTSQVLSRIENRIIKTISSFLFYLVRKFKSSFGLLLLIAWISAIKSLKENTGLGLVLNWPFQIPFLENFSTAIELLAKEISSYNIGIILPEIPFISNILFSGTTGLLLRIAAVLTIFWEIFRKGWGTLINPLYEEIRDMEGVKLDWYEMIALPLGIGFVIMALLLENSDLQTLPPLLFQIGLVFGGLLHFIVNKNDRNQMWLVAIILILSTLFISILFTWKIDRPLPLLIGSGIFALLIIIIWIIPFSTSPSLFRFLGRPVTFGISPTKLWKFIASELRFDKNSHRLLFSHPFKSEEEEMGKISSNGQPNLVYDLEISRIRYLAKRSIEKDQFEDDDLINDPIDENFLDAIYSFDLMSLLGIVFFYILVPITIFKLLLFVSLIYLPLILVAGLLYWYRYGLPKEARMMIKTDEFSLYQKLGLIILFENICHYQDDKLVRLDLSQWDVYHFAESFTVLSNLVEYSRIYSDSDDPDFVDYIPENIGQMKGLQKLDLSVIFHLQPKYTELPQSFAQLENLVELNFSGNDLKFLPKNFSELNNIKKLDLDKNNIQSLGSEITNLSNLEILSLAKNPITEISNTIFSLQKLRELNLDNTMIEELPENIHTLVNLEELSVRGTILVELPDKLCLLENLHTLKIRNTLIKQLPPDFDKLRSLQSIDITDCEFLNVDDKLKRHWEQNGVYVLSE